MLSTLRRIVMSATPPARVPIPRNGVDYRGKVVLAPMVRSGELPARLTALHYGADLVWGPETIDRAMIGCTRRFDSITNTVVFSRQSHNGQKKASPDTKESVIFRTHPEREKGKLIYQIGTADPELAVQAAKMVAGDVSGIDVNSGCPKPFSTSGGMGAALLRTPGKLCNILTSLVKEVGEPFEIGISVKIRLLETPEETRALVERLVKTGITGLTIHCRTTPMRPRERAIREQLRMIGEICREAGVACLMNGDVVHKEDGLTLAAEYGVDGAMIATAAEANPSVFRTTAAGGHAPWREIAHVYLKNALDVDNKWGNTKFTLAQILPGRVDAVKEIHTKGKNCFMTAELLGFEDLYEQAKEVDKRIGLEDPKSRLEKAKQNNKSAKGAGRSALSVKDSNRKPLSTRGVEATKAPVIEEQIPAEPAGVSLATA